MKLRQCDHCGAQAPVDAKWIPRDCAIWRRGLMIRLFHTLRILYDLAVLTAKGEVVLRRGRWHLTEKGKRTAGELV